MRLEIAATKANLLAVKAVLQQAREGHELLVQKREVLLAELLHLIHDVKRVREEADAALAAAYGTLRLVLAQVGGAGAARLAAASQPQLEVTVRERSVMGVAVPLAEVESMPVQPLWGLGESPSVVDVMAAHFRRALKVLVEEAEIEQTVWRLGRELARTQRRANALEYIVIPQHQETAAFIEDMLDEREREAHFQLKRIKHRRSR